MTGVTPSFQSSLRLPEGGYDEGIHGAHRANGSVGAVMEANIRLLGAEGVNTHPFRGDHQGIGTNQVLYRVCRQVLGGGGRSWPIQ